MAVRQRRLPIRSSCLKAINEFAVCRELHESWLARMNLSAVMQAQRRAGMPAHRPPALALHERNPAPAGQVVYLSPIYAEVIAQLPLGGASLMVSLCGIRDDSLWPPFVYRMKIDALAPQTHQFESL
jgi:hypothetical protein